MISNLTRFVIVGAALAIGIAVGSASAGEEEFSLGPWGAIKFQVPDGWVVELQNPDSESGTAIQFAPPDAPIILLITPIPVPDETFLNHAVSKHNPER